MRKHDSRDSFAQAERRHTESVFRLRFRSAFLADELPQQRSIHSFFK